MSIIWGLTVGRNEEHRYLEPMLQAAAETFSALFFYDDRSEDHTAEIASEYALVVQRPHEVPSFLEQEGLFRQGAWRAFEQALQPVEGDWVFVIDCDECLVGTKTLGPREALNQVVETATAPAVNIDIPEVFGFTEQVPMIRVDGLWGTIHAPRLFRYRPGGSYVLQHFGVPAQPSYVLAGARSDTELLHLLHYGYAHTADVAAKYNRYRGQLGHSSQHVNSIIDPGELVPWTGCFDTRMQRGER